MLSQLVPLSAPPLGVQTHQVPTPKTILIHKNDLKKPLEGLNFPCVLKLPDGAFSKGVKKVGDENEMKEFLQQFFQKSDLVIAQEFMPTPFDWRVGVLNGKPIYVCKYYMARNHWQIVNWKGENIARQGKSESLPISQVPPKIIKLALKATSLIGNGLYGVDIKEYKRKYYVIEVNDNPSIDSGIEDKVEKNKVYEVIMGHLMSLVVNK